jgi:ribokinase
VSVPVRRAERIDSSLIAVVGSANVDLVARVDRLPGPGETVAAHGSSLGVGGKGLNQAVMARRLGADVRFCGAVGDDRYAEMITEVLQAESIDTSGLAVHSGPSGLALIVVDGEAENSIVVVPGANAAMTAPVIDEHTCVVLMQLEVPRETVRAACRRGREIDALTILNPAPAVLEPSDLHELAGHIDILVPNEHELAALGGPDAVLEAGITTVVVTRGRRGVEVYHEASHWVEAPFAVTAIDSTGAGDAFCGALAARLALGSPLGEAVRWGAAAGAAATETAGATPPSLMSVRNLVASRT